MAHATAASTTDLSAIAPCPQEPVRQRAEETPTEPAREHTEPEPTALDQVIAALPDAINQAMKKILPGKHSEEMAARIAEDMTARLLQAQQGDAPCTVWPGLCAETGEHDDHANHQLSATETGWPVSVGFVDLGRPLLYIDTGMAADFDPEDAPQVAAQLRAAADAVEDMQAKVNAARSKRA